MSELRLIIDPPLGGPMNMAIDEALLESAATDGIATLRLYQWSEPTLSLGYFQSADERQTHQPSIACPLVRRASGGGAILHDRELTYSLALPDSLALPEKSSAALASRRLYDLCHSTLISVFNHLGVFSTMQGRLGVCENAHASGDQPTFLCFQRRTCFDVVLSGQKVVGSAQRRRRGAVLQHGSILLSRSHFAPELPGIEQISGRPIGHRELIELWPPQLAGELKCSLVPRELTAMEKKLTQDLCQQRFAAQDWLYRR